MAAAVRMEADGVALLVEVVVEGVVGFGLCSLASSVLGVVFVVVYARVAGELVGAGETLLAAGERAEERLLSGVRSYVAGLACDLV